LDRLVFDRKRIAEIFEFDYQLEMYSGCQTPVGYYALPILYGDRLVASSTPRPTSGGVLRITAIHEDVDFSSTVRAAVDGEIRDRRSGSSWRSTPAEISCCDRCMPRSTACTGASIT